MSARMASQWRVERNGEALILSVHRSELEKMRKGWLKK
jgi:hypothetical protein